MSTGFMGLLSHFSNSRGGAKVIKSINEEVGMNVKVGILL